MTSELLKVTLKLLSKTSRDCWPDLAKKLGVTTAWLRQLDNKQITDPGVQKIERLYNELSGNTLDI